MNGCPEAAQGGPPRGRTALLALILNMWEGQGVRPYNPLPCAVLSRALACDLHGGTSVLSTTVQPSCILTNAGGRQAFPLPVMSVTQAEAAASEEGFHIPSVHPWTLNHFVIAGHGCLLPRQRDGLRAAR